MRAGFHDGKGGTGEPSPSVLHASPFVLPGRVTNWFTLLTNGQLSTLSMPARRKEW